MRLSRGPCWTRLNELWGWQHSYIESTELHAAHAAISIAPLACCSVPCRTLSLLTLRSNSLERVRVLVWNPPRRRRSIFLSSAFSASGPVHVQASWVKMDSRYNADQAGLQRQLRGPMWDREGCSLLLRGLMQAGSRSPHIGGTAGCDAGCARKLHTSGGLAGFAGFPPLGIAMDLRCCPADAGSRPVEPLERPPGASVDDGLLLLLFHEQLACRWRLCI